MFWKEADVRLEREFAGQVHLDGLLNAATAPEWDVEYDGETQHADVYVADHLGFIEGLDAGRAISRAAGDAARRGQEPPRRQSG